MKSRAHIYCDTRFTLINTIAIIVVLQVLSCDQRTVIKATRRNVIESVYATGRIVAQDEHNLCALSNGIVIKKLISDGDTIRKGENLFEISSVATKGGLNVSAEKVHFIQQFVSAQSEEEVYYLKADCDGIAYETMKQQGEAVRLNEPIVLLGQAADHFVSMSVDQQDIGKIRIGQLALIKTDMTGDSIYKATISRIYPVMNENSQSFRVNALFAQPFPQSFIHNPVEANIVINEKQNALVIPATAIQGKDSLLVERNGSIQKIKVKTGILLPGYIEILDGVDEETPIIVTTQNHN